MWVLCPLVLWSGCQATCGVPWLMSWQEPAKDWSVAGKDLFSDRGDNRPQSDGSPYVTLGKSLPLSGPQLDSKMVWTAAFGVPFLPGKAVICPS